MPHTTRASDQRFLREAIELAAENAGLGRGGPFAALVVRAGQVIARCTNRVTALNDPTAHAEVEAIREACRHLGDYQLSGCTIYASCEPCPMCLGAIYWARPERVVFAATRDAAAAAGFDDALIYTELALPPVERSIPFERLDIPGAGVPFDRWREAEGRVDY